MRAPKIGLLGGSFNPAHDGHVYISETAIRSLGLDQVWWLVSPQNPLKPVDGMEAFETRFAAAQKQAASSRILVSDFETKIGQTYTAHTISALKEAYPLYNFVWLMGADNLIQIPKWHHWQEIFEQVPVAVFDRPGYTYRALSSHAARIYASYRVFPPGSGRPIQDFAIQTTPTWTFISHTKHKLSSTYIRNLRDSSGKACSSS